LEAATVYLHTAGSFQIFFFVRSIVVLNELVNKVTAITEQTTSITLINIQSIIELHEQQTSQYGSIYET